MCPVHKTVLQGVLLLCSVTTVDFHIFVGQVAAPGRGHSGAFIQADDNLHRIGGQYSCCFFFVEGHRSGGFHHHNFSSLAAEQNVHRLRVEGSSGITHRSQYSSPVC